MRWPPASGMKRHPVTRVATLALGAGPCGALLSVGLYIHYILAHTGALRTRQHRPRRLHRARAPTHALHAASCVPGASVLLYPGCVPSSTPRHGHCAPPRTLHSCQAPCAHPHSFDAERHRQNSSSFIQFHSLQALGPSVPEAAVRRRRSEVLPREGVRLGVRVWPQRLLRRVRRRRPADLQCALCCFLWLALFCLVVCVCAGGLDALAAVML